ncbi:MAG: hypothetical protein FWE92_01790 [Defluviitaleaceae bacterium]|nr:hypothetical protein [Defluviitaleaceae bacterium]
MRRAEVVLTVLLILFVALAFALVALLFTYNFVVTEGQTGVRVLAEAAEPDSNAPQDYAVMTADVAAVPGFGGFAGIDNADRGRVDAYTRIVFERNYVLDGIVLTSEEPIPHFAINMDKESLAQVYANWDIVDFTPQRVTMRRNITGQRAEHYVVTEHEGFVAVFRRNGAAPLSLVEVTRTPLSSLSLSEQARIREGVVVYSEEALLRIIQDYES